MQPVGNQGSPLFISHEAGDPSGFPDEITSGLQEQSDLAECAALPQDMTDAEEDSRPSLTRKRVTIDETRNQTYYFETDSDTVKPKKRRTHAKEKRKYRITVKDDTTLVFSFEESTSEPVSPSPDGQNSQQYPSAQSRAASAPELHSSQEMPSTPSIDKQPEQ